MTGTPHPYVIASFGRQRRDDLLTEVARERLARPAANRGADPRLPWADLAAVGMVIAGLALLLAAGSVMAEPSPQQDRLRLVPAHERAVTQVPNEHLLDPIAAEQISAARW